MDNTNSNTNKNIIDDLNKEELDLNRYGHTLTLSKE